MILTSSVFRNLQRIPTRYTGEGENVSPPLEWSFVPDHCKEFALICEDPDAPKNPNKDYPFVHWIAYNIPGSTSSLPEGIDTRQRLSIPVSIDQGVNSFGKLGYGGPMPPLESGPHHYHFTLYALDAELGLAPGLTKEDLIKSIKGHVITTSEIIGTYERTVNQRRHYAKEAEAKVSFKKKPPSEGIPGHHQ